MSINYLSTASQSKINIPRRLAVSKIGKATLAKQRLVKLLDNNFPANSLYYLQ